jgi:hypothetical protein
MKRTNADIYAKLVNHVENENRNNRTFTRFEMLGELEKLEIILNQASFDAVEKLYIDGFIKE